MTRGCASSPRAVSFNGMMHYRLAMVHTIAGIKSELMGYKHYLYLTFGGVFIGGPWSLSALKQIHNQLDRVD